MHPAIKKFSLSGEVSDNMLVRQRDLLDRVMSDKMRETGYVPVLGLGPLFSTVYDQERDVFCFEVSYYGVRVGKKSWIIDGMDLGGKMINRSTPKDKSGPSSQELE